MGFDLVMRVSLVRKRWSVVLDGVHRDSPEWRVEKAGDGDTIIVGFVPQFNRKQPQWGR